MRTACLDMCLAPQLTYDKQICRGVDTVAADVERDREISGAHLRTDANAAAEIAPCCCCWGCAGGALCSCVPLVELLTPLQGNLPHVKCCLHVRGCLHVAICELYDPGCTSVLCEVNR